MNAPFLDTLEVTGSFAKHVDILQLPSRTSLRVYKHISDYCEADLFKFVPKLAPHLEFLSLPRCMERYDRCDPLSGTKAVERAAGPPGFSLYELSFSGPFPWLQWTLSSTRNTLTILDLHDSLSEDHFEAILSAHGASLRSLRLSNAEHPLPDKASVSLSHCVRLQEFRYVHLPSDATLDHLPLSTLEHLELTLDNRKFNNMGIRLASLANWIAKSKLSIFTWNWLDVPMIWNPWRDINRLVEVCIDSRIELRYFEPPLGTWTGERYAQPLFYLSYSLHSYLPLTT